MLRLSHHHSEQPKLAKEEIRPSYRNQPTLPMYPSFPTHSLTCKNNKMIVDFKQSRLEWFAMQQPLLTLKRCQTKENSNLSINVFSILFVFSPIEILYFNHNFLKK